MRVVLLGGALLTLAGCNETDRRTPAPPAPTPASPAYTVGGTVSGLVGTLVLVNNGGDPRTVDANGAFTFRTPLANNAAYAVTVQTQPANQLCTVANGAGDVAAASVTNVAVVCQTVRVAGVVGPSGGTVVGPDGASVEIPPGALAQPTTIAVARSGAGAPAAPSESLTADPLWEFTPHDLRFAQPVTIRLPLATSGTGTPTVLVSGPGSDWQDAEATVAGGTATVVRDSFSWYGAFLCAVGPDTPDDGCVIPSLNVTPSAVPSSALTRIGVPQQNSWRMTEAGTLQVSARYRVRGRCIDANARLRRTLVRTDGTVAPAVIVAESAAPLTVEQGGAYGLRGDGSVTLSTPVDRADNGLWLYSLTLACTRDGRTVTMVEGFGLEVDVSQPTVTYAVGGSVSGLAGSGLVLQNNAGDDLAVSGNGAFTFATPVAAGGAYAVTVRTQPSNPAQNCTVQNGTGTAQAAVTNVAVTCVTQTVKSWNGPVPLEGLAAGVEEQLVVGMDASGNAIAAWITRVRNPTTFVSTFELRARRYTPAGGWGAPVVVTEIVDGAVVNPSLAVFADGRAVLVWEHVVGIQYDIYSSAFAPGTGWSTAAAIETDSAEARFPRLAFHDSGVAFAIWDQETGPFRTEDIWANRYVAGSGWGTAVRLEENDSGAGRARIAVGGNGDAIAIWDQFSTGISTARYTAGQGWSSPTIIPNTSDLDAELEIAMDDAGRAVVAYSRRGTQGFVKALQYVNGWSAVDTLRGGTDNAQQLRVAMNGAGAAMVTWLEGTGPYAVWARPYGTASGAATTLATPAGAWPPDVAVGADGSALVAWTEPAANVVRERRYTPGAATPWAPAVDVATNASALSADGVRVATDANGNAAAVWRAQPAGGGEYDAWVNVYR